MMEQNNPIGKPLQILLVEDDPAHANLVITGMDRHRIANRIIHVSDGEKALDYLYRREEYEDEEKSPRPNLILLDLRLPKIDGLEVLAEIKKSETLSSIPVVILTTSNAERDVSAGITYKFLNSVSIITWSLVASFTMRSYVVVSHVFLSIPKPLVVFP